MAVKATIVQLTPEQVERVYYTERGDVVTLTDHDGTPIEEGLCIRKGALTADQAARKLFRDQISTFNRPLTYGATGWR